MTRINKLAKRGLVKEGTVWRVGFKDGKLTTVTSVEGGWQWVSDLQMNPKNASGVTDFTLPLSARIPVRLVRSWGVWNVVEEDYQKVEIAALAAIEASK